MASRTTGERESSKIDEIIEKFDGTRRESERVRAQAEDSLRRCPVWPDLAGALDVPSAQN